MYSDATKHFARTQEALVAPLEVRIHAQADGRAEGREECMRDYARVLYSSSFRRLQGKMQLLGVDAGNFNRNRLTHSLEVAQIARSIAADLGLERSVVAETCALAHDLGNPPFGHYGERILDELGAQHGGFEGNAQAFRILRTLEKKHHAYAGLNLTVRTLAGITKYFHRRADNAKKFLYDEDYHFLSGELARHGLSLRKTIDAQIMDLSDEIAYAAHDLEDAMSFGIITWGEILHEFRISRDFADAFEPFSRIAHGAHEEALKSEAQASSEEYSIVLRKEMTSQIVHELCRDITVIDGMHGPELGYRAMGPLARGLKTLLWKAILRKKDVQLYEKKGEKIIRGLFEVLTDRSYNRDNVLLPPELRCLDDSRERLVLDYIAGMMDVNAAAEYEKYFGKGSLERIYG
jgi:dGTPase